MRKSMKFKIIILFLLLLFTMLISITFGAIKIPLKDTGKIILSTILDKVSSLSSKIDLSDKIDTSNIKESNFFIVLNIRLPRILLAGLVGAILSLVGSAYQAIFKNPMADPFVMGVSSGAAFGATIGILLGFNIGIFGFGVISIFAFIGALLTTFIVYNLARTGNKINTLSILLAGIVMSSLLSAGISFMMIFNHDDLARIVSWTMGSFNAASWQQIIVVFIPTIIGLIFLMSLSRDLNLIVMGEEEAQTLGVNVERLKKTTLILSSVLAGLAVSVSGIIGFVGLIIPHLFRMIFSPDHRILLPTSLLGGATFLIICDTLARSLMPNMEIPVGIITALFGGPFFLFLLKRTSKNKLI